MNFIEKELVEKVKPQLISAVKNLFEKKPVPVTPKQDSVFTNKVLKNRFPSVNKELSYGENKTDVFTKKRLEDTITTPVSKKVWVNGQEYNVIAFSQQELDEKIRKIKSKAANNQQTKSVDTTELCFNAYIVKEEEPIKENEWAKMGDVWYQDYDIA